MEILKKRTIGPNIKIRRPILKEKYFCQDFFSLEKLFFFCALLEQNSQRVFESDKVPTLVYVEKEANASAQRLPRLEQPPKPPMSLGLQRVLTTI